jgi:hypothetical protein
VPGSHLTAQRLDPGILGSPISVLEEAHHPASQYAGRQHSARGQKLVEEITPDVPSGPDLLVQLDLRQRANSTVWLGDAASGVPVAGLL